MPFITTPFDKDVDRAAFDCGTHPALNSYIAEYAGQDERRNVSRTFMLVDSGVLQGFYTLAATAIDLSDLSEQQRKGLPRYPLPAVLLSRFAVSKDHQRQGLGRRLLKDIFMRVSVMSELVGVAFLVVDAKDSEAADYYRSLGFVASPSNALRLAILTKTFVGAVRGAAVKPSV